MTHTHLFLFAIGPVQSFISQARKVKDLYAGSQILSELCGIGIEHVKTLGGDVIFPYIDSSQQNQSLPNRFIARIAQNNGKSVQQIGEEVESKVRNFFVQKGKTLLNGLKIKGDKKQEFDTLFLQQIEQHLDIQWVICPIENSYKESFEKAEHILGSIKNLRPFTQNSEMGRKCSLDGKNNALLFSHLYYKPAYTESALRVYNVPMNKGEGLSAVSALKRSFTDSGFPSTAEISLMENIAGLNDDDKKKLERYKKLFSKKECVQTILEPGLTCSVSYDDDTWQTDFDHQLLFRENITERNIPNPSQRELALRFLESIESKFTDKYYAIIHFDGDKMGELISGARLSNRSDSENERLPEFQYKTSQLLASFAKWAKEYLVDPRGQAIYAGGDDFLGLINMSHLFEVLIELRREFEKQVHEKIIKEFPLTDPFTFSAGIAIAHYKEPLSLVLEQARLAEKIAKDDEGGNRDAFCISVSKGSGQGHQTCFKWYLNDADVIMTINKLVKCLHEGHVSKRFITAFGAEMNLLMEDGLLNGADYEKIIHSELRRLMRRAKSSSVSKNEVEKFADRLFSLYQSQNNENPSFLGIGNFLQLLYISDFISRHISQIPTIGNN